MRPKILLIAMAMAWVAGPLAAGNRPSEPLATLASPVDGAVLASGEQVWLEWLPAGLLSRPDIVPKILEWEAFLSLDGGESYPFRITPHLAIENRRVLFRVPGFASRNARLLLRFGDEAEEHPVELGIRLEIEVHPSTPSPPRASWAAAPGEAAKEGGLGTAFWVEGDREGRGLRWVETRASGLTLIPRRVLVGWALGLAAAGPPATPKLHPPSSQAVDARCSPTDELQLRPAPVLRSRPLLALHQRLNT